MIFTSRLLSLPLALFCALNLFPGEGAEAATLISTDATRAGFDRFDLQFGGFLQPRFTVIPDDEDNGATGELGFSLSRVRMETSADLVKTLRPGFDLTFTPAFSVEFMPEPVLKDAYVQADFGGRVRLRAGQFKAPINRSNLISDRRLLFPDRPLVSSYLPDRDLGVQVSGNLGKNHLEWAAGAFNGEGTNRISNVNDKFLYAARVVVSPLGGPGTTSEMIPLDNGKDQKERVVFSVGYSIHYNVKGEPGEEEASLGHDVEGFFHYRWFTLQGEFAHRRTNFEAEEVPDYNASGWYVQLGAFLPGVPWAQDHIALLFRMEEGDSFDPVSQDVPLAGPTDPYQGSRNVSVGASFYAGKPLFKLIHDLKFSVIYVARTELEDQPFANDRFLVFSQLAF